MNMTITIREDQKFHAIYAMAAKAQNKSISQWIRDTLKKEVLSFEVKK